MCFGKMCFLSVNSLILFQLLDASEHKHGDQECNDEDENECDSWNYEYFISFVAADQLLTPFERWIWLQELQYLAKKTATSYIYRVYKGISKQIQASAVI